MIAIAGGITLLQAANRPDPARLSSEQNAVFSAYLFDYPLYARPLPTLCDPLQQENASQEAQRIDVSDKSLSGLAATRVLAALPIHKFEASGVPITTFNNFLVRNLTAGRIDSISRPPTVELAFPQQSSDGPKEDGRVSVAFSAVGFNRDFSWAMFYAKFKCKTENGAEYVYLTRDWKHGQHWYVAGVNRVRGSGITEQPTGDTK